MSFNKDQWRILLYTTLQGEMPVHEFICSLEFKTQSKVYNVLELLKIFGVSAGSPHIKKLIGTNLWELRILGSDSIRIFYVAITGKTFLLLHGFKKKTNKTPPKEIRTAEDRFRTFKSKNVY